MAPKSAIWTDSRKLDLLQTHILVTGRQKIDKDAIHKHWLGDEPVPTPRAIADTFNAMMRAIGDRAVLNSFKEETKGEDVGNLLIKSEVPTALISKFTPAKKASITPLTPKSRSSTKRKRTRNILSDEDDVMNDVDNSDESDQDEPYTPAPKRRFRQQRKAAPKAALVASNQPEGSDISDMEEDKMARSHGGGSDDDSDGEYAPPTP